MSAETQVKVEIILRQSFQFMGKTSGPRGVFRLYKQSAYRYLGVLTSQNFRNKYSLKL